MSSGSRAAMVGLFGVPSHAMEDINTEHHIHVLSVTCHRQENALDITELFVMAQIWPPGPPMWLFGRNDVQVVTFHCRSRQVRIGLVEPLAGVIASEEIDKDCPYQSSLQPGWSTAYIHKSDAR